jgi:hypothetical protein
LKLLRGQFAPSNALFVLSIPLIAEVARKYVYYSDWWFAAGDCIVAIFALWAIVHARVKPAWSPIFLFPLLIFTIYVTVGDFVLQNAPIIFAIGLRTTLMPFIYLAAGAYAMSGGGEPSLYRIEKQAKLWIIVLAGFACLQLALGRASPINDLPTESIGRGMGDYTNAGVSVLGMFRPTSVFMHTGKYAQVLSLLILAHWALILKSLRTKTSSVNLLFGVAEIVGLVVSGSRAALLSVTLGLLGYMILWPRQSVRRISKKLVPVLLLAVVAAMLFVPNNVLDLVGGRFASTVSDAPKRFETNLVEPWEAVVSVGGPVGAGLGYYVSSSARYGGQALYQTVGSNAEDAWLRICAETGVAGLLLFCVVLATLAGRAYFRAKKGGYMAALSGFAFCWLITVAVWNITHDYLGDPTATCIGFFLTGAIFATGRVEASARAADSVAQLRLFSPLSESPGRLQRSKR